MGTSPLQFPDVGDGRTRAASLTPPAAPGTPSGFPLPSLKTYQLPGQTVCKGPVTAPHSLIRASFSAVNPGGAGSSGAASSPPVLYICQVEVRTWPPVVPPSSVVALSSPHRASLRHTRVPPTLPLKGTPLSPEKFFRSFLP